MMNDWRLANVHPGYYHLDNGTGKIRGIGGQGTLGAMALFRQWIESVRLEYGSRTHHSNVDFVDRVQRDHLVQQAAVAAVFAWYTANGPKKLPRRTVAPAASTAQ